MKVVKFCLGMILTTIFATLVWEIAIANRAYHCTDEVGFGYLSPGDWVHGEVIRTENLPRTVAQSTMADPDVLHSDWSLRKLWATWFTFLSLSIAVSLTFAVTSFTSAKPRQQKRHA